MAGKKEAFSPEENLLLRDALRKLRVDRGLSQAAIADALDMTQQNVSRLLAPAVRSPGGMGRSTANALARALGYRDAEHYLFEAALAASGEVSSGAGGASEREFAVSIAHRLGYEEAAIAAVVARYADAGSARGRPVKWWITKFGEEERELAADLASAQRERPRLLPAAPPKP